MERLRGFGPNGFSPEILRDITGYKYRILSLVQGPI